MCGICGIISKKLKDFPIKEVTSSLAHRGPDDAGYYVDEMAALGHRRLSIIDLASGHQPMFNEDRSCCIVFNGEIYNYLELRQDLLAKGHRFLSNSDTETILHAYEEWGEKSVERLRGMFSYAIWDKRSKKLFLARDRLGIKPLYYADISGELIFASEIKAILASRRVSTDIDEAALASYFTLSYVPAPWTIFERIKKLPPGHTLTWEAGKATIREYWRLVVAPDRGKNERYFLDRFLELFGETVQSHLISDVPLGAFLSGGVDSSLVVAMMSGHGGEKVRTFTIGFGGNTGGYLDERVYARMVAERYSTVHREYEVLPDVQVLVEPIVRALDEPLADDSAIPSYHVCKMARQEVTVALSGLGGDEAFAGYERYLGFGLRRLYSRLPRFVRESAIRPIVDRLPERADGHYTVNHMKRFVRTGQASADSAYFDFISRLSPALARTLFANAERFMRNREECKGLVLGHFNSQNVQDGPDSLNRALYCDIKTYLADDILAVTDRMSMCHSLEVRVPFIDHRLLEFCATIPPELKLNWLRKKYLLKKAALRYLPKKVVFHRKQGFIGPMTRWLQTDLRQYIEETLNRSRLERHGIFAPEAVRKILDEHFSGKEIHDSLIWSLVVFQKWHEMYM